MIFFDIDETLFDNQNAQKEASRKLYDDFDMLHDLYEASEFSYIWDQVTEKYVQLYLKNQLSFQEQRRNRLREIFQKSFSDHKADKIIAVYLKYYEESWQLFDDVMPCLNQLKAHRLGIISNGDAIQQIQKLKHLNILKRFEVIVISGQMGISKPNPEIFRAACRKAKENQKMCFHIGDSFTIDAKAASDAGLTGIWLNRKKNKENCKDIIELQHLGHLVEVIQKGGIDDHIPFRQDT